MNLANYLYLTSIGAWASIQLPFLRKPASTISSSPLLELHKALVERPSTSGSEKPVTDFLKSYLQDAGLTVEIQPVADQRDNVFAYYNNTRDTKVLVTSHVDTVPPYWPYERRGDEIWGRGTVDAKGSVAAQIIAVQELFQKGKISEGDVALLFVVGEEVGGLGMKNANDLGLSWESVIFGEPTELKLARGHKGGVGFTIKARGKAGHSGYPETGSNAIDSLVRGLFALQKMSLPWSDEFGNSTLNIGKIEGGVAGNVIPGDASATGGVRVAGGTPDEIRDLIRRTVEESDPNLVPEFSSYGVGPVSTDYDVEGFETAVLSYGTDIPSLKGRHKKYLYGPGSILDAHSAHEHLKVSDLEQAVDGYQILISHALDKSSEL
ncbi:acetylornithine deacetylase [Fusarium avenaceum]|nr:acetylornithine deacetylase [Fusarium avenaceum]